MNDLVKNQNVQFIFNQFNKKGYQIYIVGGAVRDFLLNKEIQDVDFTTDARPEIINSLFDKTIEVGKRFGTIKVILNNEQFEITTFRTESLYSDKRHPEKVNFSKDLLEDIKRRDFTINALIMNKDGKIEDYFNGISDLENKIIRTIGKPSERFNEDQLRKWRAIRFAAENKFYLEPLTYQAILNNPDTEMISIERIQEELNKIIKSPNPIWGGYLLIKTNLLPLLFNRIGLSSQNYLDLKFLLDPFRLIQNINNNLALRYSALFINYPITELNLALKKLKLSNKLIKEIISYLESFHLIKNINKEKNINIVLKKIIPKIGKENINNFFSLIFAAEKLDLISKKYNYSDFYSTAINIIKNKEPLTIKDLDINGNDLKKLEFKGKEIRNILSYLLDKVLVNPEINKKSVLIKIVQNEKFNLT